MYMIRTKSNFIWELCIAAHFCIYQIAGTGISDDTAMFVMLVHWFRKMCSTKFPEELADVLNKCHDKFWSVDGRFWVFFTLHHSVLSHAMISVAHSPGLFELYVVVDTIGLKLWVAMWIDLSKLASISPFAFVARNLAVFG